MIQTICFSKDRASQLRLLLISIARNSPNVFNLNILYKSSNEDYDRAYKKLQEENIISGINWIPETNFKQQTIELLESQSEFSCFFTDDDIIYRPFSITEITDKLKSDNDVFCFSLRLGTNVTWCYTMNASNVLGDYTDEGNTIKWEWSKRYLDFGYPLSVDGHIFRTKEILKLSKAISFHNPNTFEGNLQIFDNYPKEFMTSFKESVLVNSPSNIVNDTHPNLNGNKFSYTQQELNEKFLQGLNIDLDSIDFSKIIGCHQELEFKFK